MTPLVDGRREVEAVLGVELGGWLTLGPGVGHGMLSGMRVAQRHCSPRRIWILAALCVCVHRMQNVEAGGGELPCLWRVSSGCCAEWKVRGSRLPRPGRKLPLRCTALTRPADAGSGERRETKLPCAALYFSGLIADGKEPPVLA